MALNANVIGLNRIQPRGIHNVRPRRAPYVVAPRTVAFFATHIPLGRRLGLDIIVNGMTAVAERPGRASRVRLRIKIGPPVGALCDVVGSPDLMAHVPLAA